ncbi:plasmid replication initiation protein [Deinococcus metalli]|uniref:Plasmid replication initiation protein n=1 Tax=Deinococcus metalli TaxID=1141878 RepID=A0A7W8KHU1_9DEIO|nr:replication initiator protein A [Deinococcus metalli]MBB5378446.1 plasmid replication initiation protein [Deinococcus metalli]GHF57766.1 hypothetical protein GCM10017781_37460 [Deinococcus metalli]
MSQGNEQWINELTLARSGVFSILNRDSGDDQSWETTFSIGDRHFYVQGVAARGRPHGVDPDVLLALQTLFFEAGCPDDDTVECTAYRLLKLTPLGIRGNAYARLRESLLRLEGVSWLTRISRQSGGRFRGTTETNRLIDRVSVRDTSLSASGEGGTIEAGAPLRVTFSRHFAQSIREGFYQILDAELLSDLKQPTARSLYRVLQAHRVGDDGSLARELPVIMAAWREATGLSGQRHNNVRRTLDGAHVHLIAAKYLRDVSYEGSGEGTRIRYEFEGEVDPELVGLLTDMRVSRPVAEALVTDHPDRIRPAVKAVRQRLEEGYRPRSLAATMVDAVRNPEKYDVRSSAPNAVPTLPRVKAQPEPQPLLLPLNREESLGMVRSILRVKLGRVPRDEAVLKLASLSADQVDRLVAAARGQEDLVKAVEELVGEAV